MCFECARTSSGGQVLLGALVPCWSLHVLASLFLSFLKTSGSFDSAFSALSPMTFMCWGRGRGEQKMLTRQWSCWVHASQRKILLLCFCRVLCSFLKHCILMTIFHPNTPRKKFSPNPFHLIRKLRYREVRSPRSLDLSRVVLGLELGSRLFTLSSWVSS